MPRIFIEFPFNPALSENKRLGYSPRNGRMYANNDYKKAKNALTLAISFVKAEEKAKFSPGHKVHISLTVLKPNRHSDASNFIKPINDAISESIGVNDNLFCGSYGWGIDKKNPRFAVSIIQ